MNPIQGIENNNPPIVIRGIKWLSIIKIEVEFIINIPRIIIKGIEKGEKVSYQYNLLDRYQNNTISMARTTGFTCTAVANLVLEKKYDKIGISPPEYLGDHFEYISNYLSQRNVNYKVKKII